MKDYIQQTICRMLSQQEQKFSDIHIEAGAPMRVRIPLGLVPIAKEAPPVSQDQILEFLAAHESLSRDDWQKRIDAGGGQYSTVFAVENVNLRVALFNVGGDFNGRLRRWALALRVLPSSIPEFSTLGLPMELRALFRKENGIIFITGITGSGKSTTLAASIEDVNQTEQHRIITLEDPPEFIYESKLSMISQRQRGIDFVDYAAGVSQAMRQDPNIIVVGEINDLNSLRGAITAANSGHLVCATMHTVNAPETVNRVIDLYPEAEKPIIRNMFSQLMVAVVSQKLVPSIKGDRYYLTHEIMANSAAIANIIREDKIHQLKNEINKQQPLFHTMNSSLYDLVKEDLVSEERALAATYDRDGLASLLGHQ